MIADADCIASLKEIGPDQIMRFLKRERVGDDPDLWFDEVNYKNSYVYSGMAHFVLLPAMFTAPPPRGAALYALSAVMMRRTNQRAHRIP